MRRILPLLSFAYLWFWAPPTHAATTLETAAMGPAGQSGGGAVVSATSWFGAIVSLDAPGEVISVGAHLVSTGSGPVFAAVLPIDSITGLPPCLDLSCALATELVTPPNPSAEVSVPMSVSLAAGDYALLFGSGAAGATGQATAPLNNPMLGNPTFLGRVFFSGEFTWVPQVGQIDARFFMQLAVCGDGVVDPGEGCDDGNAVDTDACLSVCMVATCGDGFVYADEEECDPADARGPACTRDCTIEVEGSTGSTGGSSSTGDLDGTTSSSGSATESSSEAGGGASTGDSGSSSDDTTGPQGSTTGTAGGTTGPLGTTQGPETTGSGTSEADAPEPAADGCSCRGPGGPGGSGVLVLMALLGLRRR